MCELFVSDEYDAALLVDASIAFNSLNRIVAYTILAYVPILRAGISLTN